MKPAAVSEKNNNSQQSAKKSIRTSFRKKLYIAKRRVLLREKPYDAISWIKLLILIFFVFIILMVLINMITDTGMPSEQAKDEKEIKIGVNISGQLSKHILTNCPVILKRQNL